MKKILRVLVSLVALVLLVSGVRWLIDPSAAAGALGMTLQDGVGRSSQIGDMSAYFIAFGLFVLLGLVTVKRSWFYAPVIVLGLTAVFRIMAWLLHDAALAVDLIIAEIVIVSLLGLAIRHLAERE